MHLPDDAPCPCGSGKAAGGCCIRLGPVVQRDGRRAIERRLEIPQASLPLSRPRTGRAVEGCYAACLCDCDGDLEDEHPISHWMLKQLAAGATTLRVRGIDPKRPDLVRPVSPKKLTAPVLCKRHNRALLPIDTAGNRFFETIASIGHALIEPPRAGGQAVGINGHDLERWCLKALCGLVARVKKPIPELWPRILFGEASILHPRGLYFFARVGELLAGDDIRAETVTFNGEEVGIIARILNHELVFSMHPTRPVTLERHVGKELLYRPGAFASTNPASGAEMVLSLTWHDSFFHTHVTSVWGTSPP